MPAKTHELWWILLLTAEASAIAESIGDKLSSLVAAAAALEAGQQLGIPDIVVRRLTRDIGAGREPSFTPWNSVAPRRKRIAATKRIAVTQPVAV
jgi:hypothetical protein